MKVYYLVRALVMILLGIVPQSVSRSRRVKRIVNGQLVDLEAQPRVASLRLASAMNHLCGATVLSRQYAVTAAHCVSLRKKYALVLNNKATRPVLDILDIQIHHQYNKYSLTHDIALLSINTTEISDDTWLDENILPENMLGISGECTAYGYGTSNFDVQQTTEELYSTSLKIVSLDECYEKLGQYMAPHPDAGMLCAKGIAGGDTCQGDSGSPMLCAGLLQGISSHGMSCGIPGLPAVYTAIACHRKWIENIIDSLETDAQEWCPS